MLGRIYFSMNKNYKINFQFCQGNFERQYLLYMLYIYIYLLFENLSKSKKVDKIDKPFLDIKKSVNKFIALL